MMITVESILAKKTDDDEFFNPYITANDWLHLLICSVPSVVVGVLCQRRSACIPAVTVEI